MSGADCDAGDWTPRHPLSPGLHVVATPIGNLGDVTLRALWVLRRVDLILCEDTRVTARLLARHGIETPLQPYHDHNAERVRPAIVAALRDGARLALVSAAPGPSAALTALILSGLPPEPFLFAGFLPPRSPARRRALAEWTRLRATLVFFEGRSRLAAALADLALVLGDRSAAVARELTKRHEEIRRGRLSELAAHYRGAGAPRGEAVIVVGPPEAAPPPADSDIDARLSTLIARHSLRDAVALLAGETGIARRILYERALALRDAGAAS